MIIGRFLKQNFVPELAKSGLIVPLLLDDDHSS
jgi:hypothetical protein